MPDAASSEPRNPVERAADAAMRAVEAALPEGATIGSLYLALHVRGLPKGELDAVTAATGDDLDDDLDVRARDVIAFLVSEASQAGKAIGLDVRIVPVPGAHGQG